ncbi:hypothetical protein [Roseivirga echinicomitans]|uniref:Uncharacterized protein n=1 Tax=Roseivirga echinicomitans TaxID=296218 RepID=A0A150XV04_9BACT|nr:hypothetical protein [Roseivirga echinicomitans]KYG82474.1 hypothetical protein AWN68_14565 [Roseivirga echinicomitans]
MTNLKQSSGKYLLELGLEDLHHESKNWLSEIELWQVELSFFQKLLGNHAKDFKSIDDKKKIEQFQNFILFYSKELLLEVKNEVEGHEKSLASQLQSKTGRVNEATYRTNHHKIEEKIGGIRGQIHFKKTDFFKFIEPVI